MSETPKTPRHLWEEFMAQIDMIVREAGGINAFRSGLGHMMDNHLYLTVQSPTYELQYVCRRIKLPTVDELIEIDQEGLQDEIRLALAEVLTERATLVIPAPKYRKGRIKRLPDVIWVRFDEAKVLFHAIADIDDLAEILPISLTSELKTRAEVARLKREVRHAEMTAVGCLTAVNKALIRHAKARLQLDEARANLAAMQ
ncbi:hypothetical protein HGA91_05415 [candidate division WWE3 bacterium]|nr:hypothetical protein [candidate division WWE3 bacterium]